MSTPDLRRIGLFGGADNDTGRIHLVDDALALGDDRGARVTGHDRLHAGAHERGLGTQQRHGLTLHVRAHERAVGVVVLEERDERRGNRNDLLGRNVHQVDVSLSASGRCRRHGGQRQVVDELALVVELGVGLGDVVLGLFHGRQIDDVVGDLAVHDLAVRASR